MHNYGSEKFYVVAVLQKLEGVTWTILLVNTVFPIDCLYTEGRSQDIGASGRCVTCAKKVNLLLFVFVRSVTLSLYTFALCLVVRLSSQATVHLPTAVSCSTGSDTSTFPHTGVVVALTSNRKSKQSHLETSTPPNEPRASFTSILHTRFISKQGHHLHLRLAQNPGIALRHRHSVNQDLELDSQLVEKQNETNIFVQDQARYYKLD